MVEVLVIFFLINILGFGTDRIIHFSVTFWCNSSECDRNAFKHIDPVIVHPTGRSVGCSVQTTLVRLGVGSGLTSRGCRRGFHRLSLNHNLSFDQISVFSGHLHQCSDTHNCCLKGGYNLQNEANICLDMYIMSHISMILAPQFCNSLNSTSSDCSCKCRLVWRIVHLLDRCAAVVLSVLLLMFFFFKLHLLFHYLSANHKLSSPSERHYQMEEYLQKSVQNCAPLDSVSANCTMGLMHMFSSSLAIKWT